MITFRINLEVRSRVGTQHNETFRAWHRMQGSDKTPMKVNGSKTCSSL